MVLPPLFSPALVRLTVPLVPPLIVTPAVFNIVLPVVTDVNDGVMLVSMVRLVPLWVTVILPLVPCDTFTVAPGATLEAGPPFADRFQPPPASCPIA